MYLPGPGFAVGLEAARVLGRAQQAAAVQRVGDRARAVIATDWNEPCPPPNTYGLVAISSRPRSREPRHPRSRLRRRPRCCCCRSRRSSGPAEPGQRVAGRVERARVVHADHAPGRRADDAVDGQAVAGLQAADSALGFRAEGAVDGEVQRLLQPRDRVGGDLRFGRARCVAARCRPPWLMGRVEFVS